MPKFAASMLDTPCSTGFPPLCIAAARNDFRAVDILLKAGAAPNVRCESIVTGAKSAVHFVVSVGGGAPGTAVMCVCVSLTVVRKFLRSSGLPTVGTRCQWFQRHALGSRAGLLPVPSIAYRRRGFYEIDGQSHTALSPDDGRSHADRCCKTIPADSSSGVHAEHSTQCQRSNCKATNRPQPRVVRTDNVRDETKLR